MGLRISEMGLESTNETAVSTHKDRDFSGVRIDLVKQWWLLFFC